MRKLTTAAIGAACLVLGAGGATLYADTGSLSIQVSEIAVADQAGYEVSGVDKVRETIKANGGKLIAGGYNKATALEGAAPDNRFLVFVYPNKDAANKAWESIKPWLATVKEKKLVSSFRVIDVEGVEQK
jgi:uncharacterized protein (DUF1330 family)